MVGRGILKWIVAEMGMRIMAQNIQCLSEKFVVVDLDTGTVLGTNCVLVPNDAFSSDDLSDSEIISEAEEKAVALYADVYDFRK